MISEGIRKVLADAEQLYLRRPSIFLALQCSPHLLRRPSIQIIADSAYCHKSCPHNTLGQAHICHAFVTFACQHSMLPFLEKNVCS